jgi:pyruvate formate lyase activating enzyme
MSKSRQMDVLANKAMPEEIAQAAKKLDCRSVAYTYNDPVIFLEYATDTAEACHQLHLKNIAVTAAYISAEAREDFFSRMDAANVDLKGFSEDFYRKLTGGHLPPVLDTLRYLKHETDLWFEITNLLIPGHNDSGDELKRMLEWIVNELGEDVPLHFSAFHPDYKMMDVSATPADKLKEARELALSSGLHYVYTGNVHDSHGGSTWCPECGELLIERDWYVLGTWNLNHQGGCRNCGTEIPGRFDANPGTWGAKRLPVVL